MLADMGTYTMAFNGKTIGKIMIWNATPISKANVELQNPITYGTTDIFTE